LPSIDLRCCLGSREEETKCNKALKEHRRSCSRVCREPVFSEGKMKEKK